MHSLCNHRRHWRCRKTGVFIKSKFNFSINIAVFCYGSAQAQICILQWFFFSWSFSSPIKSTYKWKHSFRLRLTKQLTAKQLQLQQHPVCHPVTVSSNNDEGTPTGLGFLEKQRLRLLRPTDFWVSVKYCGRRCNERIKSTQKSPSETDTTFLRQLLLLLRHFTDYSGDGVSASSGIVQDCGGLFFLQWLKF